MAGSVCEFGTPLLHHRQPAQQRSCLVLASLIHRLPARLDLPRLSEADAPARDRSREWRGADQACVRGVRRGGGANQRAVGVTRFKTPASCSTSRRARWRTAWHSKRSPPCPRSDPRLIRPALGSRLVQGHGSAHESLQSPLVYLLALVEVDGAPCVPVKAGVEEARRILQSRPLGEGHLHDVLVSLACADQSVVRPHRNPSPLPLLADFGIGFLHENTEPAEHLAPPVAQLLDSRVYHLRRRLAFLRPALLHA